MKASVIIPVYNTEKYLTQCVESVLNQRNTETEIILVNDGSTDSSPYIFDELAKRHNTIKVIHKKNGGASSARNVGIAVATGDVVFFIDSDDFWKDEFAVRNILSRFQESNIDFVEFGSQKCNESATTFFQPDYINKPSDEDCQKLSDKKTEQYKLLLSKGALIASACNKAIKRKLFTEHNLMFNEGIIAEDVDWVARLLLYSSSAALYNKTVLIYRQRKESVSHTVTTHSVKNILKNFYYIEFLDPGNDTINCYIAIAFTNLLIHISMMTRNELASILPDINHFLHFLKYGQTKRCRLVYSINKRFGIRFTLLLIKIAFCAHNWIKK